MLPHARRTLGALVCALLLLVIAQPAAASEGDAGKPVSVATYNIHHAQGVDDRLDLERIASEIERTGADIAGLQEVDRHWSERSDFVDEAAWLADSLDMHAVYGANLDLDPAAPGQERRQYGTAILSRFPIQSWSNTYLPKIDDHEQRGLLVADIKVRGVEMRFANTHLQHDNSPERIMQAEKIVELLGDNPKRTVLTGDLNATADTTEIKTLTSVLTDSWAEVGVGDGYTYSQEDPHARIDYVLSSPDVQPRRTQVLTTADGSDHLPMVADFAVRR